MNVTSFSSSTTVNLTAAIAFRHFSLVMQAKGIQLLASSRHFLGNFL